ncbi:MAG: hypothetical protein EXS47_02520 [Candidatus Zambryskibacteria bacterium]|nr:hypothetical protein [Candidatus Zambryskibacteria bacterium]
MKLSKLFHVLGAVVGWVGVIALLSAWLAGENGMMFGFTQTHLFIDAAILVLIAIWMQLATMHHMKLEKKGEII